MKNVLVIFLFIFVSIYAEAGRTVRHQHKCPGFFKGMDLCINYVFPESIRINDTDSIDFEVNFYTPKSAYNGSEEKEYIEMTPYGDIQGTLMLMTHSHDGNYLYIPVKVRKLNTGRYMVEGARFTKSGQWTLILDLYKNQKHINTGNLYMYIYPDEN